MGSVWFQGQSMAELGLTSVPSLQRYAAMGLLRAATVGRFVSVFFSFPAPNFMFLFFFFPYLFFFILRCALPL